MNDMRLIVRSRTDVDAADELIRGCDRFVYAVVRRETAGHETAMQRRGLDDSDLMQIGYIAVWKAARAFDPERGVHFSTLAAVCIHNDLVAALRAASGSCQCDSLSAEIPNRHRYEVTLESFLSAPDDTEREAVDRVVSEEIVKRVRAGLGSIRNRRSRELSCLVVAGVLAGLPQREIAKRVGCSQSYLSRRLVDLRRRAMLQWKAAGDV